MGGRQDVFNYDVTDLQRIDLEHLKQSPCFSITAWKNQKKCWVLDLPFSEENWEKIRIGMIDDLMFQEKYHSHYDDAIEFSYLPSVGMELKVGENPYLLKEWF